MDLIEEDNEDNIFPDGLSMASISNDSCDEELTVYVSDSTESPNGGSLSMVSSSDDSDSMASTSCSCSKCKVKRKKNCEMCKMMEENEAWLARWMYRIERNKKLRKYRATGSWDGDDEITDEDYRVMIGWQEIEKQKNLERAQRVALMHRTADGVLRCFPKPRRSRGCS